MLSARNGNARLGGFIHSSGVDPAMAMKGEDEADKMLDVYIYDLLKKRNFDESAKAFLNESGLSTDSAKVAIDAPGGFLLEWWTVFWDLFKVRSGQPHSETAASYLEAQQIKIREQQQQRLGMTQRGQLQGLPDHNLNNNVVAASPRMSLELRSPAGDAPLRKQSILSPEILAAKKTMQLRRERSTENLLINDPLLQSTGFVDNRGGSSSTNPSPNPNISFVEQGSSQHNMAILSGSQGLMNQPQGGDAAHLISERVQPKGPSQAGLTNVGLRRHLVMSSQGTGLENSMQSSAQFTSAQRVLAAQMQHQMYLRLLNHQTSNQAGPQHMSMGSGLNFPGLPNNPGDDLDHSDGALGSPSTSQGQRSVDNREKYLTMSQTQQLQQSNTNMVSQQLQQQQSQQDKFIGVKDGTSTIGRKRKEKSDSSQYPGSADNFEAEVDFLESANSDSTLQQFTGQFNAQQQQLQNQIAISTASPSTVNIGSSGELEFGHAADNMDLQVESSMPILQEVLSIAAKSLPESRPNPSIQAPEVYASRKFSFREVGCLRASTSKVLSCHFSSDGKLLASAGHDKKVNLWNMATLKLQHTLEEHSLLITGVRFSPTATHLATSSFDKTVRVWEVRNPASSIRTLQGHATSVWALDFHPNNEDLLCSCDGDSEIRYWSVSQGTCLKSFKGGVTQLRFQTRIGRFLAAGAENVVTIFDVESETSVYCLLNHSKPVNNLCWSASGECLVSLTEDYVRVWSVGSSNVDGAERSRCLHELRSKEKVFQSCVFHPNYPSLLVIGCYQSMELWNMAENKILTLAAHDGLIVSLVSCPINGLVASASHDKCVKLWQ